MELHTLVIAFRPLSIGVSSKLNRSHRPVRKRFCKTSVDVLASTGAECSKCGRSHRIAIPIWWKPRKCSDVSTFHQSLSLSRSFGGDIKVWPTSGVLNEIANRLFDFHSTMKPFSAPWAIACLSQSSDILVSKSNVLQRKLDIKGAQNYTLITMTQFSRYHIHLGCVNGTLPSEWHESTWER